MNERSEFYPKLRLSQTELKKFQTTIVDLVGEESKTIGWKEYPVDLNGEAKVAEVIASDEGKSTTYRLRDSKPTGPTNAYVYEEIFCTEVDKEKLFLGYSQGSLEKNKDGDLVKPAMDTTDTSVFLNAMMDVVADQLIRRTLDGEPIDEFRKAMSVLEQIKLDETKAPETLFKAKPEPKPNEPKGWFKKRFGK